MVDVKTYSTDGPVKTSCFISGTQVAVEGGSVAIESLTEGTRVITRVDPAEYGVASDEDVAVTLKETILCGFSKSQRHLDRRFYRN